MDNPRSEVAVVPILAQDFHNFHDEIVEIYRQAFSQPPYNEGEGGAIRFAAALERHHNREGFRCVVARPGDDRSIVGFTFGYTARQGHWWRDTVASTMEPAEVNFWLSDCFELAELALLPAYQGLGIGGRLLDTLLMDVRHRTSLLSTIQAETNAMHLYRKRGWVTVIDNFIFPGSLLSYRIMGLDLERRRYNE
jgi:GNAT superfamily N-acetyltransferase